MSEENYKGIINLLNMFITAGRYSIVDKIAYALSPDVIKSALYEAVRLAETMRNNSLRVKLKLDNNKEVEITCCEYDVKIDNPPSRRVIIGTVEKVYGGKGGYKGKKIYCVPCRGIPSEEELRKFLNEIEKGNLDLAREIAIKAYGLPASRESEKSK